MAKFFRKQPITLKHPDNTCSKKLKLSNSKDLLGNSQIFSLVSFNGDFLILYKWCGVDCD